MELEKVRSMPIKGNLHELLAKAKIPKAPKFDNVARMPAHDLMKNFLNAEAS
jgi:hypothetical protein